MYRCNAVGSEPKVSLGLPAPSESVLGQGKNHQRKCDEQHIKMLLLVQGIQIVWPNLNTFVNVYRN